MKPIDEEPIHQDMNEDGIVLDPGKFDDNPEEEKEIKLYPKSNERNAEFVTRIMNSKSFEPENEEEEKMLEDTFLEVSELKTLGLLSYIFRRSGRNVKKSIKKSVLGAVALEVGIQNKIYWANYNDKNEGNLKTGNGIKVKKMGKKKIFGKGIEQKKMEVDKIYYRYG